MKFNFNPVALAALYSFAVCALFLPSHSFAQSKNIDPVDVTEIVKIDIPSTFKLGFTASSKTERIAEFVPLEEVTEIEQWSEMITAQMFNNKYTTAEQFVTSFVEGWMKACKGEKSIYAQQNGRENGYLYSSVTVHCPQSPVTDLPETASVKVIQGKAGLYSIQRAYRGPLNPSKSQMVTNFVGSAFVCDGSDPEHACKAK